LQSTLPPKSFASTCEDVDVDVYEYEGYIAGLVDSYLSGSSVDSADIDRSNDLYRRLGECETSLHDLKAYLDLVSEVATLLTECVSTNS
jgi:hypothetical protein